MEMTPTEVKQAVKDAAIEAGAQTAQQIAEQVGQAVSQAIQKFMQTTGTSTAGTGVFTREEMGDIGGTEAHERSLNNETGLVFTNSKRTYDEYQQESLESIKRNRSYVDKVLSDAATHDNRSRVIAEQALQNAVETANMIGKQAVAHRDIAIDNEWNPVQQGAADTMTVKAVQLDDASVKAIAAALATAFTQAVTTTK
jgi:hypothetical protein